MDGAMGRWRDVSDWLSAGGGYTQGQIALCCSVIFQAGVWRPCRDRVIDLYAGVSTTPVEIMVEDKMPDFLELASTDSRGCDYSPGGSSKTDLGFPQASCTPVEMCAVDSNFPGRAFRRARFVRKDRTI